MPSGFDHPPGKKQSRERNGLRDGSAKQPIVQFPPPPSQSRFRSTPLSAQLDLAQARKLKPRSRSRPALLAVKEPPKTNARGKKKEHTFRKETHHRSVETQTRAAPAKNSKQPTKRKPSKSRLGPLPVVDKTVSETAEHQGTTHRPRVCAFCDHPHGVEKCARYRTKAQRVRRARELGYCFICLRVGHLAKTCPWKSASPCYLCNQGQHHRALCPLTSPMTASVKQAPPRRSQPSINAHRPAATTQKPVSKVAKEDPQA
ncbi:Zinc knuckle family protein [Aphelenchoides avenae]|nr:Zinc knuckle family protein [Aphelenchus avenae]